MKGELDILRSATLRCAKLVCECQPPRMGVRALENQYLTLDVAHVNLFRADMIVLRGGGAQIYKGVSERTFAYSLDRWAWWPEMADLLKDAVFLACVRVMPCATTIHNRDIFVPSLDIL